MKKAKKTGRRVLSLIMTMSMLLNSFVFFNVSSLAVNDPVAVDKNSVSVNGGGMDDKVYLNVPEEIYLAPAVNSYVSQGKYNYQWYVDSQFNTTTHATTLRTGENSSGNFDFYFEYATQISVSYKFLNSQMNDMATATSTSTDYANSDCYIKLASNSNNLLASNTSSSNIQYNVSGKSLNTTITNNSVSPYLLAATTGYYIEWNVSFVDSRDGLTKYATAYTYVYKPFVQPVAIANRTKNNRGDDSYGSCISWVSGVHGLNSTGAYYPKSDVGAGAFIPFSSSNASGVQLGTMGEKLYAQHANSTQANGYFQYECDGSNPDNWFLNTATTNFKTASINYTNNGTNGSNRGDNAFYTYGVSPIAKIMVDSSRYSNMSGIPNLSLGLIVTDRDGSKGDGAWYIADYTGKTYSTSENKGYQKGTTPSVCTDYWNDYTSIMFNQGSYSSNASGVAVCGMKYNGRWVKSINTSNTSGYYNVKTAVYFKDGSPGDTCWDIGVLQIYVTMNNKQNLRTSLQNAIGKLAYYSVKADGSSYYYDTTSSYMANFVALYKAAGKLLANLDTMTSITVNGTSYDCNSLATALNNAMANVETLDRHVTITFDSQSATTQGTTSIVAIYGKPMANITVPTRTGYTLNGYYSQTNNNGAKYYNADGTPTKNLDLEFYTTLYAGWTINKYAIVFKNYDNTVLQNSEFTYNTTPVYSGATPTRAPDGAGHYAFTGWSPSVAIVSGVATYTAQFSCTAHSYTYVNAGTTHKHVCSVCGYVESETAHDWDMDGHCQHCDAVDTTKANYTEVDRALSLIPKNMDYYYTAESIAKVNAAKNAVVRDLYVARQSQVDKMAKDIRDAVTGLTFIQLSVTSTTKNVKIEYSTREGAPYRVACVTAPATDSLGRNFSYWIDTTNGTSEIVSSYTTYYFFVCRNTRIEAVYGSDYTKAEIATRVMNVRNNNDGTSSVLVEHSVSKNHTINMHGVLFTTDPSAESDLTIGNENTNVYNTPAASTATKRSGLLEVSFNNNSETTVYARPYIIDRETGEPTYGKTVEYSLGNQSEPASSTSSVLSVNEMSTEDIAENVDDNTDEKPETSIFKSILNSIIAVIKFLLALLPINI